MPLNGRRQYLTKRPTWTKHHSALQGFIARPTPLQEATSRKVQVMKLKRESQPPQARETLLSRQDQNHSCPNQKASVLQNKPNHLPIQHHLNNMDFLLHSKFNKCRDTRVVQEVACFLHYRNLTVQFTLPLLSLRLVIASMTTELVHLMLSLTLPVTILMNSSQNHQQSYLVQETPPPQTPLPQQQNPP